MSISTAPSLLNSTRIVFVIEIQSRLYHQNLPSLSFNAGLRKSMIKRREFAIAHDILDDVINSNKFHINNFYVIRSRMISQLPIFTPENLIKFSPQTPDIQASWASLVNFDYFTSILTIILQVARLYDSTFSI